MAKSKARKKREKIVRENKLDPTKMRSAFTSSQDGFRFLTTKKTKTKKEKLEQLENKHKKNLIDFN